MSCFALQLPLASHGAAGTFLLSLPPPIMFVAVRAAGGHLLGHFWVRCIQWISAALPTRIATRKASAALTRVGPRLMKLKSQLHPSLPPSPRCLTGGTFVPLGCCKQVNLGTWQKEQTLAFLVVHANPFQSLLSEKSDSLAQVST